MLAHTQGMNPYLPPVPGGDFPPPQAQSQGDGPSQTRCIVWLVLSCLTICGCGIFFVIPVGLSIVALVKREQDPKLALLLNRIAIGCVITGWVLLLVSIVLNIVLAASH
ncbi:MAG: hypothetical protein R3B07_21810 [Polyangiaceae bacterium]